MLIAALVAFLIIHLDVHSAAVTGPLDQAAALIKKDVSDEARQKQALAIVDQMKSEAKAYADKRAKSIDELTKLTAKRTTPSSEIAQAEQPLINEDRAVAEKLL